MNILYLIPARGGSKGIPNKNIRDLNGKPLICHTIDAARAVSADEDIFVSTDSTEIMKVVEDYGLRVKALRPHHLATDIANTESVVLYTLDLLKKQAKEYLFVAVLQPTSPLRNGQHLKEALKLLNNDTEALISVFDTKSNPYYLLYEENQNGELIKSKSGRFTRRQDCPKVYELNGAIYIYRIESLLKKGIANLKINKFLMDRESSIDIDDLIDFDMAQLILNKKNEF